MNIQYTSHSLTLTSEITAYVEEKIASIKNVMSAGEADERFEVELGHDDGRKEGKEFRADFSYFNAGEKIHAVGHGNTINEAIDEAKDEIKRRITKTHGRMRELLRKGQLRIKRMMKREIGE